MAVKVTAVKLNRSGFDHAKRLVDQGKVVRDDRDLWSEHQPSTQDENRFIEEHGFAEYGKWHLGIDTDANVNSKGTTSFRMATSRGCTGVACCRPRSGRTSASTPISKRRRRTCAT